VGAHVGRRFCAVKSFLLFMVLSQQAKGGEQPSPQVETFYNARISLREGNPTDAMKFWMLHQSLFQMERQKNLFEADFRSVLWASLAELSLCPDGVPIDNAGGAGLWPLAAHNWLIINGGREGAEQQNPFDAFEAQTQQRFVSVHDVLSLEELKTVEFAAGSTCFLPNVLQFNRGESVFIALDDPLKLIPLLRSLLKQSLTTLDLKKVVSTVPIQARMFDLDLALVEAQRNALQRKGRAAEEMAREVGVTASGARSAGKLAEQWKPDSPQAVFLRNALLWKSSEWMLLSSERRLFLFAQAQFFAPPGETLERVLLSIVDELIAQKNGVELSQWLGFLNDSKFKQQKPIVFESVRGEQLLSMDIQTGFKERSVIALHRGVSFLESGHLFESLSAFAFALSKADESSQAEKCRALSLRWLSFVLAQFEATPEVIAVLKALVPKRDYVTVIEDLVWRAAWLSDAASFERLASTTPKGASFDVKVENLRPLSLGNAGALANRLRDAALDQPYLTLRFVKQLLERLQLESAEVRKAQLPTLKVLLEVLAQIEVSQGPKSSTARIAKEQIAVVNSMLDGLLVFNPSEQAKARNLDRQREAFAGNIRLAPSDALPWPFSMPEPSPPSPLVPLKLVPVEWRGEAQQLIFGWKFTE
jgi:hypothetical protein